MKIINRTAIGIDVQGFSLDPRHVRIPRSEDYFVGKRFGGELELSGFTPGELRSLHTVKGSIAAVDATASQLPAHALELPEVKRMREAAESMRRHLAKLPSLEVLEQFEAETEDGFYLYPRAQPCDTHPGVKAGKSH